MIIAVALLTATCAAQSQQSESPLWRGSRGFSLIALASLNPLSARAFTRYSSANLNYLRSTGVDFVRIPFDPSSILAQASGSPGESRLISYVMEAVNTALAHGFKVLLDSHVLIDGSPWAAAAILDHYPEGPKWIRYKAFVQTMGSKLSAYDPAKVAFQQFNEMPEKQSSFNEKVLDLYQAFRTANERQTVIIGGDEYSSIMGIENWTMAGFSGNFIVGITPYLPQQFTHQGIPDDKFYAGYYRLSWPPAPVERKAIEDKIRAYPFCERQRMRRCYRSAGIQTDALIFMDDYFSIPKDDAWLSAQLDIFVAFRERNKLRNEQLIITEFGSHGDFITAGGGLIPRAAWMTAMRTKIEERGWGWSVWHWDNGFFTIGFPELNPTMGAALGLKP